MKFKSLSFLPEKEMFRQGRWERPSYSSVAGGRGLFPRNEKPGGGGGGGEGGGRNQSTSTYGTGQSRLSSTNGMEGEQSRNTSIDEATRQIIRDDQQARARQKSFIFKQKLMLEERRRKLGKGSIVTFLIDPKIESKQPFMNNVLKTAGFKPSDVKSIKINEFRNNQIEVLFQDEVLINIEMIENKIREKGLMVQVVKFDDKQEVLMLYGLPLSEDMELMKKMIQEAIGPFVKNIVEIKATKHHSYEDDDFFSNTLDGNFLIRVNPKSGVQIPNFVVIGKEQKVCAKAVYSKSLSPKANMCHDCYATDHLMNDPLCPGPREWEDYCKQFEGWWEAEISSVSAEGEVASMVLAGDVESPIVRSAEVCREMRERNDSLEARINSLEGENVEITGQLANSNDVISEKDEEIRTLKEKCEVLEQVIGRRGVQEEGIVKRTGEENNESDEEEEEDENPLMNVSDEKEVEEESWADQIENEDDSSSSPEVCNENNKRDRTSPGLANLKLKTTRRNFDEIVIGANYVFNRTENGKVLKTMGKLQEFSDPWARMLVKEKDGRNMVYRVDVRCANLGRQYSHP